MTKYICDICQDTFEDFEDAFDHLVDKHGDVLEREYIIEGAE